MAEWAGTNEKLHGTSPCLEDMVGHLGHRILGDYSKAISCFENCKVREFQSPSLASAEVSRPRVCEDGHVLGMEMPSFPIVPRSWP
jgi:hypothetical protein